MLAAVEPDGGPVPVSLDGQIEAAAAFIAEAAGPKLAFVDMQRALRETAEGKQAKTRLEKMKERLS